MLKIFEPDEYVKSVFEIDFEALYNRGFCGVVFDIDNTLVYQDEDSNEKVGRLFEKLRSLGFKTVILSNNSEERVSRFSKSISSPYLSRARKPFKSGYIRALRLIGVEKRQAVFVGDRLLTDILGAKRAGIRCILVEYIKKDSEKPNVIRKLEARLYKRQYGKRQGG